MCDSNGISRRGFWCAGSAFLLSFTGLRNSLAQPAGYSDFDCSTIVPSVDQVLETENAENDELFEDPSGNLSPEGTVRRALRWRKGDSQKKASEKIVLGVGFLDDPGAKWISEVKKRALLWTGAGGGRLGSLIEFDFEIPAEDCHIRVRRTGLNTPARNNSRVGRSALNVTNRNKETMNIYNLDSVMHEFGHALGLVHEHTNPGVPVTLLKQETIAYYHEKFGWNAITTTRNLFSTGERCLKDPAYNEASIMGYRIPQHITKEKIDLYPGKEISSRDLTCAVSLYAT